MHSKTKDFEKVYKLLFKGKDPIHTWVIKQFRNKVKEKINILYVGCGYGILGYKIANLSKNFNVVGIDKINQKDWWFYLKSKTKYNNLNFLSKNIKSFKSNIKFDYTVSIKVLHYIIINK